MQRIEEIAVLRDRLREARRQLLPVGVVPTMGALHEGHLSLLRRARADNGLVVMTLFVNPTQFNDPSDYDRYPRDLARDAQLAEGESVDLFFIPSKEEMYGEGFVTSVSVGGLSDRLEGASRPGHFVGVSTVVCKLLGITTPDRAYFGEKDWQQLQVVRRMVVDLNIPTEIVAMPTVREDDSLAMSSRNVRLSPEDRRASAILSKALNLVESHVNQGEEDSALLTALLRDTVLSEFRAVLDYAVVVDPETMLEVDTVASGGLAAVAATFGGVRLIDNRLLRRKCP